LDCHFCFDLTSVTEALILVSHALFNLIFCVGACIPWNNLHIVQL
jgi:hypothetical protein